MPDDSEASAPWAGCAPTASVFTAGDRSVAADAVYGDVHTGDRYNGDHLCGNARKVTLAPGVLQPPDEVGAPAAGAHSLPRRPSPVFVGRDELLVKVAALFAPPTGAGRVGGARAAVGQAITGLGGIGKSELALQYAASRTGPGAVVWWADAENGETLELALAGLAYRLQPKATAEEWTTPQAADWAVGWLQAHTGWLLILDNVENPDLITGLLGKLSTGDILLTTRRRIAWGKHGVTPLTLQLLRRPSAVRLLRHTVLATCRDLEVSPPDGLDADTADAIADELGDLPLALEQAGAYLAAHHLSLATYLQRLRAQTTATLGQTAPGTDPQRAVARVFALTVETFISEQAAVVDILRALAWLAPVPLPRQVITHPACAEPDGAAADKNPDVDGLLGLLASYSVITLTPDTVAVHRLVQAVVRDHDRAASHREESAAGLTGGQATALAWLADAVPDAPDTNVAGWSVWRELLPHLDALFDHLAPELRNLDLADLLGLAGLFLWKQGRLQHSLRLEERALAITEAVLGPDHPDTVDQLDNVGLTLAALGRHKDAMPLQERVAAITEDILGPEHPDTAIRQDNLASTLAALGQFSRALSLRQRAVATIEAALGADHEHSAIAQSNLANILIGLGRHVEALPLQQRALAVTEAALGPDHPDTAVRLDNLAAILTALGRPTDALSLQQRALAVTEAALGADHPSSATRLSNLADTLEALGRHDEALSLQQRALAVTEAALGPDHPDTATTLNNLAATLADLGRPTDALPLQQRALAITQAALAPDHPNTATALGNLAAILDSLGRHSEATEVRERIPTVISYVEDRSAGTAGS